MADIQQQQNQLRQQRESLEAQRRRVISQKNIRQGQDINALLQRNRQLQQIGQQDAALQSQLSQIEQIRRQQEEASKAVNREELKQSALSNLIRTGKANDAFRALSKQEQSEVQDLANELERQQASARGRIAGTQAVATVETQLASSLSPELRKQVYSQAFEKAASGVSRFTINLPDINRSPTGQSQVKFTQISNSQQQVMTPAPKGLGNNIYFRGTDPITEAE